MPEWPQWNRALALVPSKPDGSKDCKPADLQFCIWAIQRGWSIEETAARLLEVSPQARERRKFKGETYAIRTAQKAAAAVPRERSADEQQTELQELLVRAPGFAEGLTADLKAKCLRGETINCGPDWAGIQPTELTREIYEVHNMVAHTPGMTKETWSDIWLRFSGIKYDGKYGTAILKTLRHASVADNLEELNKGNEVFGEEEICAEAASPADKSPTAKNVVLLLKEIFEDDQHVQELLSNWDDPSVKERQLMKDTGLELHEIKNAKKRIRRRLRPVATDVLTFLQREHNDPAADEQLRIKLIAILRNTRRHLGKAN